MKFILPLITGFVFGASAIVFGVAGNYVSASLLAIGMNESQQGRK